MHVLWYVMCTVCVWCDVHVVCVLHGVCVFVLQDTVLVTLDHGIPRDVWSALQIDNHHHHHLSLSLYIYIYKVECQVFIETDSPV